jgi:NADH-quinone oxidoreductase subunit J
MSLVFYLSAAVAIVCGFMVITRTNAVHALLYLILSLLSVAIIFFVQGAPFAAALEVIIYAGAIMVLFVFVIMMLNLGLRTRQQERRWLTPWVWAGPSVLALILIFEVAYLLMAAGSHPSGMSETPPKEVTIALLGPYLVGVELASLLLLAGLLGAYHLARRTTSSTTEQGEQA